MNFNFSASFSFPLSWNSNQSQEPLFDLQNSIKQGNITVLKDLITESGSINQPLPNGEMPLHFAVRENQQKIVSFLLEQGADPDVKDFQNLSAIDHAVLMNNNEMLACILGKKIGTELKEINEQIKCKGSAAHVNELKTKIQKISTVDVSKLNSVSKAAYLGNIEELGQLSKLNINKIDAHGLTPIHYAILGRQSEAVEKLIELGSDLKMLSLDGDSLLHFAAISGSLPIIKTLISSGIDLNCKNPSGATALHYASANENLVIVEALIRSGANPSILDNKGMSSLALIGTSAYQRDPLSLSKTQTKLFAATAIYWFSTLAPISDESRFILTLVSCVGIYWNEFALLIQNLDKSWKKTIAWMGVFGLSLIPPLNVGFQAWRTYHVAYSAFQGLKNCWRNVGYRNWDVARNVVVHSANTANSFNLLYNDSKITYDFFKKDLPFLINSAPYMARMLKALINEDSGAYMEARAEYQRFLMDIYGDIAYQGEKIDASTLENLSTVERLSKTELDPKFPEHALMMMSPKFTMDQLREKGRSLYRGTYTELIKEVHPDKAGKLASDLATRLNEAYGTLNECVQKECWNNIP